MNEPLVCWVSLLIIATWGVCSGRQNVQLCLVKYIRCAIRPLQWYNLSLVFLSLFFIRTMYDIVKYDFIAYHFLDPDVYTKNCAGVPEEVLKEAVVGLPLYLRILSGLSPIFGLIAFVIICANMWRYVNQSWEFKIHYMSEEGNQFRQQYAKWVANPTVFLPLLVIGMPLVFIVMSLRATIREWAIMTCSGWHSMHMQEPQMSFEEVKSLELATYQSDLAVACAFQYLAVWCFGQACAMAIEAKITEVNPDDKGDDKYALMQAGILGIHAFTVLGLLKSILQIILAALSTNVEMTAHVSTIQQVIQTKVDPMFLFATILCVINMIMLARIREVKASLGDDVNTRFTVTRILLLIGQGQFMVLTSCTTQNPNYEKIMSFLHKVPHLEHLQWNFNIDQARLVHSSLLCFECCVVAYFNWRVWYPKPLPKVAPLLDSAGEPNNDVESMQPPAPVPGGSA